MSYRRNHAASLLNDSRNSAEREQFLSIVKTLPSKNGRSSLDITYFPEDDILEVLDLHGIFFVSITGASWSAKIEVDRSNDTLTVSFGGGAQVSFPNFSKRLTVDVEEPSQEVKAIRSIWRSLEHLRRAPQLSRGKRKGSFLKKVRDTKK